MEQALADERAKTAKMHDKLLQIKTEMETAAKAIERFKNEKKAQKQKVKNMAAIAMQQETQIQMRQDQLDEQARIITEMRRESEKKDFDVKEMQGQVTLFKQKLEEAQKNLESNA